MRRPAPDGLEADKKEAGNEVGLHGRGEQGRNILRADTDDRLGLGDRIQPRCRPLRGEGPSAKGLRNHECVYMMTLKGSHQTAKGPDLFRQLDYRSLRSAANPVVLPELEPGAMRQRFIV